MLEQPTQRKRFINPSKSRIPAYGGESPVAILFEEDKVTAFPASKLLYMLLAEK